MRISGSNHVYSIFLGFLGCPQLQKRLPFPALFLCFLFCCCPAAVDLLWCDSKFVGLFNIFFSEQWQLWLCAWLCLLKKLYGYFRPSRMTRSLGCRCMHASMQKALYENVSSVKLGTGLLYLWVYPQCLKHSLGPRRCSVTCWDGACSDRNWNHVFSSPRLTQLEWLVESPRIGRKEVISCQASMVGL